MIEIVTAVLGGLIVLIFWLLSRKLSETNQNLMYLFEEFEKFKDLKPKVEMSSLKVSEDKPKTEIMKIQDTIHAINIKMKDLEKLISEMYG